MSNYYILRQKDKIGYIVMRTQATRHSSFSLSGAVLDRLREGAFIIGCALGLYLLVALLSFDNADPGWSHVGGRHEIANACGHVGAYIADIFLYVFGYLAFSFPFALVHGTWLLIVKEREERGDYPLFVARSIGFILAVVSLCGLFSLAITAKQTFLPFTAGGIVGAMAGPGIAIAFKPFGAALILFALLLAGITFFTGYSWLQGLEAIGRGVSYAVEWSWQKIKLVFQRIKPSKSVEIDTKPPIVTAPVPIIPEPVEEKLPSIKERIKRLTQKRAAVDIPETPKPTSIPEKATDKAPVFKVSVKRGTLPSLRLLDRAELSTAPSYSNEALHEMSELVEVRLKDFGVTAKVVGVQPGPVVTRFELELAPGVKVSKLSGLAKDLARSLSVTSVRIVEVIPGKPVVGLELPNQSRETVRLSEILASRAYKQASSALSLALGKDISGHPVVVDLAKMPHLLVAGTTGSGKSVGINAMLISILFKATPEEVRLILIDPKMLELSVYDGIPHLLAPVVTDMKEAACALRWCVNEMERRYRLMAALGVRNLHGFNQKVSAAEEKGEPLLDPLWRAVPGESAPHLTTLPFIVVVIDEFADMIMVVGKKVEQLIARIAQKARAAGIHLLLATQRPSVDVITGLIKSNVPTRIAFQVSSKIDSRTILDQSGAEQLLGYGDMLYLPPGTATPVRVHGAFVADNEVHQVANDWRSRGEPVYMHEVTTVGGDEAADDDEMFDGERDALYDEAVDFVVRARRVSISSVQRRLKIGYNRAANLVESMERAGVIGPAEGSGLREVLAPAPHEES